MSRGKDAMKTVVQEDDNGCGVACVAMLAGVSYAEARRQIYPSGRSRLTKTRDLHDALIRLGRRPHSDRRKPLGAMTIEDLESDALIFAKIENGDEPKHWLVWDAKARKIRDPLPGRRRFKMLGYLPVG